MVRLRGAARAEEDAGSPDLVGSVGVVLASGGWRADEPPSGVGAQRERWENVAALVRLAEEAQSEAEAAGAPAPTLATFTTELAERAAAQHVPTVQGVTLASFHAAKGLEWDAVFLVGLVEGVLPISYAVTPEALEEERRLLYVGVTRARRQLTLSWAKAREAGRRPRKPSRFLAGIAPASEERVKPSRSKRGGPPAQVDPKLWEALRVWRSERAAEAAGLLRLHRRHARGDREQASGDPSAAARAARSGRHQARALRTRCARGAEVRFVVALFDEKNFREINTLRVLRRCR
jgi:hypothetical protein